tara:strand:+ start:81 stop:281 length:201 start_codon:yes stop_codon:yes gene_type:complete
MVLKRYLYIIVKGILIIKNKKMKNLVKVFVKLDNLYKGGIVFVLTVIAPLVVVVTIDLIRNGSNML